MRDLFGGHRGFFRKDRLALPVTGAFGRKSNAAPTAALRLLHQRLDLGDQHEPRVGFRRRVECDVEFLDASLDGALLVTELLERPTGGEDFRRAALWW